MVVTLLEVLGPTPTVADVQGLHFERATLGCGCVGVLIDRLPPTRNPATFLDDVRGRALRVGAGQLARMLSTPRAPWPAVVAGTDVDDPPDYPPDADLPVLP